MPEPTSKAEQYADKVLAENYCDENDPDIPVNLDERVDPPARYRDMRAWLIQGYAAGYDDGLYEGGA